MKKDENETALEVLQARLLDLRRLLRGAELAKRQGRIKDAVRYYLRVAEEYRRSSYLLKAVAVYKNVIAIDEGCGEAQEGLVELYKELGLFQETEATPRPKD